MHIPAIRIVAVTGFNRPTVEALRSRHVLYTSDRGLDFKGHAPAQCRLGCGNGRHRQCDDNTRDQQDNILSEAQNALYNLTQVYNSLVNSALI
ncbi:hypothetical protein EVAR_60389_1 [Eumeta japonica]|uniref:Uncharacterized protein n=1 Tax=Eumeta variegata TaxID=151549 RepID=A0A4C2A7A7_EUMVA|nr:hypothetical protein EVAR_60389_1 [Eumeta japonica]